MFYFQRNKIQLKIIFTGNIQALGKSKCQDTHKANGIALVEFTLTMLRVLKIIS